MLTNKKQSRNYSHASPAPRTHRQSARPNPMSATSEAIPAEPAPPKADLLYLDDVEQREVEWLWQDRLAAGSVAVLSGNPGAGKTWVALAIAAALSKGQNPGAIDDTDENSVPPCTTIYASNHHQGAQLVRPRYLSLGGDPARLVLLRGAAPGDDPAAASLPLGLQDTPILEDALQRTGARLLILDPLHRYLAAGSRHRAHEAARVFDNLASLAEKHRCCILLVRHLRRRGLGSASIELSGAVRTEFLVGSSPDAPAFSALVQTKSNLGPLASSVGFLFADEGDLAFHWTGPSTLTRDDLQTDRPTGAGLPQRRFAAEWLQRQLAKGPLSHGTIERAALRDGLHMVTVRRARMDIGVLSYKSSYDGAWYWESLEGRAPARDSESKEQSGGGKNAN
jgi:hypothetical protein